MSEVLAGGVETISTGDGTGASMSERTVGSWQGSISLEQLIALNDEIAALSRAGMPLERGLLEVGSDLPGRLGAITTDIGSRMSRGENLSQALENSGAAKRAATLGRSVQI